MLLSGRLALVLVVASCARVPEIPKRDSREATKVASPDHAPSTNRLPPPREIARERVDLFLERPELLVELERNGLSLSRLLGRAFEGSDPLPKLVKDTLERDLDDLEKKDPLLGTSVAKHSHRLFPKRYLEKSSGARVVLTAVVNRVDRLDFFPSTCGELRLVYRLVYGNGEGELSRLPATFILEFEVPKEEDCANFVDAFRVDEGSDEKAVAARLTSPSGPLAPEFLALSRLKQLALNVQLVRWPAAVRPDLGGHAEYLLRAFRWNDDAKRLEVGLLENTPDLEKLTKTPSLAAELRTLLDDPETRASVERGTFLLPRHFLAERAFSFSPRGLSRTANRPFTSFFRRRDGRKALSGALSEASFLRRLDQMSCQGCHQTRSLAGFHFLGLESPDAPAGAALFVASSPHLLGDHERRSAFAERIASHETSSTPIPFADQGRPDGAFGAPCGLGDPAYAGFGCAAGYRCEAPDVPLVEADSVGVCLPERFEVGEPCETGPLDGALDPHRDRVARHTSRACASDQHCNRSAVGFPSGMCTASCASSEPHVLCGPVAVLDPFNACLARREPFTDCLEKHTRPSGLRSCSALAGCRDDYACAKVGKDAGVCVPPYFLLELRVDGHP